MNILITFLKYFLKRDIKVKLKYLGLKSIGSITKNCIVNIFKSLTVTEFCIICIYYEGIVDND